MKIKTCSGWRPEDLVGRKFGRYVVTGLLGQRGLGAVYLADDPIMGRKVALKVLASQCSTEEGIQRFHQELRLTARLKHPNLIAVHDAGEQDGRYYMAMEYINGCRLDVFATSGDRPPVLVVLRIMAAIAGGLQHAHEQQVVHRDIRPCNIVIGPTGIPVLVDFGLSAPPSGDPLLELGTIVGTPEYMAPERARGEAGGPPADIWSFGATMFQILSGRALYQGGSPEDVLAKVISEPVDLSPLEGKAPEYVTAIIRQCLRKAPAERYSSAGELKRALEVAIDLLESASGGKTMVLAQPRAGQTLLLHVECQEDCLQGAYREYDIEANIGGGAFADVYRAKERLSGRLVALKMLKQEWLADNAAVERFRREAALLSRLSHPNVLRVHNFGRYGSTFFMDMPLLDGPTLESVRCERGVLPVDEALAHTVAILKGLAAIHAAGIVHRDLKPANVAIMQGRTVIFDLGLAHSGDLARLTLSGQFLGTPLYAAPEQAEGRPATSASDVYAAGVILYELLTARTPHEADSVMGMIVKKVTDPPTRITSHRRDLPASLVGFLDRVLARKTRERPSAAEAAELLAATRGGRPVDEGALLPRVDARQDAARLPALPFVV